MWLILKLAAFMLGATVVIISGLQSKSASPRVFQYVTTTIAKVEGSRLFHHEPSGDYNFY